MQGFATTRWSLVKRASGPLDGDAREALDQLARLYWGPVYSYLRRRGFDDEAACDGAQELFGQLLEHDLLERVDPDAEGRFRSWLLKVLEHRLGNLRRKRGAAKRGGDRAQVELASGLEPADRESSPEVAFRRAWARGVIARAIEALSSEHAAAGREAEFEAIKESLAATGARPSYKALAERLDRDVGAIARLLHGARRRLRELIHRELRESVSDGASLEDEVRDLLASL